MLRHAGPIILAGVVCVVESSGAATPEERAVHDLVLRGGLIYDGSGAKPYSGAVAVDGDRITYVGPDDQLSGRTDIDVHGQAITPGFINMLAHPEESLYADGRALSDLSQGVTLEVMGEMSMGPLNDRMKKLAAAQQSDIKYPIAWTTLGESNVQPSPEQLAQMRTLVHDAMEEGALGVTTALIYTPATFARTPELIALAQESARCGGIFTAHMRSEGDRIDSALQEVIEIARSSGAPAEIYHLKLSGRSN